MDLLPRAGCMLIEPEKMYLLKPLEVISLYQAGIVPLWTVCLGLFLVHLAPHETVSLLKGYRL